MKIGQLKSLGHNIADSLASGIGFMIGIHQSNVFAEATSTHSGSVCVNFIDGQVVGGTRSESLRHAVARYKEVLPELCRKHGLALAGIKVLAARYGNDRGYGPHFTVTVEKWMEGDQSINI